MKKTILFILISVFIFLISFLHLKASEYECKTLSTEWSPKGVIISPDDKCACVMNLESCSVTVYDTTTLKLIYTIYFPQTYGLGWDYNTEANISSVAQKPVEGAFTGEGRYLWITFHNDSSVVVFDTEENRFDYLIYRDTIKAQIKYPDGTIYYKSLIRIPVERTPKVIAVSPDEKIVAVSNWHSLSVSIIDAKKFTVINTIPVSQIPRGMVFNRKGSFLYVAIMYGNYLEIIDTKNWKIKGRIEGVGSAPRDLIIDKEGRYIYCSANGSYIVSKIDTSKNKVVSYVNVGGGPRTIEFSHDEKLIYVCCYKANRLYVIDVKNFKVIDVLTTGEDPVGVDVCLSGDVWVTNQGDGSISVFQKTTNTNSSFTLFYKSQNKAFLGIQ
ncbi:MAG TPA: cytochrome D1 domain-containing protein [Candidatus Eremiobacteraeota bacterium]|nr:MAG: 6-phosphogluconolactonase [bacterium ADurb.Bin363]HPZ06761.1 cytochrome D1 domain-containing protein [Candidatus Eremiobacteraeota bacterium]